MAYNPFDDVIDQDPAYMADGGTRSSLVKKKTTDQEPYFPDVSLQPDLEATDPDPYLLKQFNENIPDYLKKLYGKPGGMPDVADLVQGSAKTILPVQEMLTPDDERNVQLAELEKAMYKNAYERIAKDYEGQPGRFTASKIGKLAEKDIGGFKANRPKAFLETIMRPQLETVQELAEGKPFYELEPMQMVDAVFAVLDTADVLGISELVRRGLTAGSRAFLEKIKNASTREGKLQIAQGDTRQFMQLRDEVNAIQKKFDRTNTTAATEEDFQLAGNMGDSFANLTGKRAFDDKRVEATKQFYDKAFDERTNFIKAKAKEKLKELNKDKFSQKEFDAFLQELYPDLTRQQIYNIRRGVRETNDKYYTTQPFTELFNAPTEKGLIDFFSKNEGKVFDKNKFYEDYGITTSTLGNFLKKNPSYNKFFNQAGKKSLISNTSQIEQVRKNNKLVDDKFNQLENFLKTQDNPNFYLESLRKKFKLDEIDPETSKQIITENNFRKYMKEQGYESKKNVIDNEDALKILRKYGLAKSKTDSGLAGRYLELMFRSITDSPAEVMKNFEKKYGFKIKETKTDKVTRDNNLKAFEKFIEDENVVDKFFGDANNFEQFARLAKEVDAANITLYDHLDKLYRRSKSENGNFHKAINKFISRFKSPKKDINRFFNTLRLELSHEFEIAKALEMNRLEGAGFDVSTIYPSYGAFNRGLQKKREKQIRDKIFKVFSKDRSEILDTDLSEKSLQAGAQLRDIAQEFDKLGITSIIPIDDPSLKNVIQNFIIRDNQGKSVSSFDIFFDSKKGTGELIIGRGANEGMRGKSFSVQALKENMINRLNELYNNPEMIKSYKSELENLPKSVLLKGAIKPFNEGGPVHMAIGGNPLENINQQEFAADPGFDGEDYFSQAVESGNLYAFNPFRLLNIFGKIDGVATPNKVKPSILPPPNADDITPALVPSVEKSDFPFQSFMMEKMYSPNAPKSAPPEAWKQYLLGGNQPVKQAEIQDSGLLQYLDDYAGYFPGKKIDRETLSQYYETSPVGNLSIKIKEANRPPAEAVEANKLFNHSGKSRHKGAGGLRIDEEGTDYREVVIQAGAIPNESKAFVNSSHFEEPNTIGFSRVANYNNMDGDTVAVIQELQTDMLTSLQKEQDRLQAMLKRLDNVKDKLQRDLNSPDIEVRNAAERHMNNINQKFPPDTIEYLKQNPSLIKPFPNEAGKIMIPDYAKELIDLQKQIDELVKAKVDTGVNELDDSIYSIAELQRSIRDKLYDLNRSVELDDQIKDFSVPDFFRRDELADFAQRDTPQLGYSTHPVKLFPNFPFQSQQDYVDLILKATIKDAQTRGIDKIAIMPAEVGPIKRWSKDKNGPSGKKFIDLYDKVTPQVMKNIAKKYDGTLQIEKIVDPSKAEKGLQYFNKDVDGSFSLLKEDVLNGDLSFGEMDSYINGKLEKAAHDMGPNNVVYTKEISPGQTMDYYVQPTTREQRSMEGVTGTVSDFELVPLGPGDDINAAQLHIVENNPQLVDMYTLTLNSPKAQEPFFLYGKKDGGKIASDGLVSITDIYGDY